MSSSILLLIISGMTSLTVGIQTLRGPRQPIGPVDHLNLPELTAKATQLLKDQQIQDNRTPANAATLKLAIRSDFISHFQANEGSQHWVPVFQALPYTRWVGKFRNINSNGTSTHDIVVSAKMPLAKITPIPAGTPLLILTLPFSNPGGKMLHSHPGYHALAITPMQKDPSSGRWQPLWDQTLYADP
jgi:hypothetical protein